jgi:hypothetical protein
VLDEKTAALPAILLCLELLLPTLRDLQAEIRALLVSILAAIQRNRGIIKIQRRWIKNFKGLLKNKRRVEKVSTVYHRKSPQRPIQQYINPFGNFL